MYESQFTYSVNLCVPSGSTNPSLIVSVFGTDTYSCASQSLRSHVQTPTHHFTGCFLGYGCAT
jgi:hypothetical protein